METFVNFATLCDDDNLNYQEFNLVKANHSHAIQNKEVYVFSAVGAYKYFVFIFNKLTNKKPGIREPEIKDFCYLYLKKHFTEETICLFRLLWLQYLRGFSHFLLNFPRFWKNSKPCQVFTIRVCLYSMSLHKVTPHIQSNLLVHLSQLRK